MGPQGWQYPQGNVTGGNFSMDNNGSLLGGRLQF